MDAPLCINCRHYQASPNGAEYDKCLRVETADRFARARPLVRGEPAPVAPAYCEMERATGAPYCGPQGIHFEARVQVAA